MLKEERWNKILQKLDQNGEVTVADLSTRFNVSEMTARRDLRDLAREGALQRVHGGAISNLGRSYEPPYSLRSTQSTQNKQLIGIRAAALINDGDSVALDVGTTTLEIARALKGKQNLTIVTASLPIANEIVMKFSIGTQIRLILTGGIVRSNELSLIGNLAERAYEEIYVDKAFIGVGGIDLQTGATEYNLEDTSVKQAMIKNSRKRIVVTDGSKLGRTTFSKIISLSEIDIVVTDSSAPPDIVKG